MNNSGAFLGNTATCQNTVDIVSSGLVLFFHGIIILTLQLDLSFTKEVCHCVVAALKPQYFTKGLCHKILIANVSLFISIHLLALSWKCGVYTTNWNKQTELKGSLSIEALCWDSWTWKVSLGGWSAVWFPEGIECWRKITESLFSVS